MAIDLPNADDRVDEAWREIDQCLAEISALALQPIDERDFYSAAMERARWALAAPAVSAWGRDADGKWIILAHAGEMTAADPRWIAQVAAGRELASVPASTKSAPRIAAPVVVDGVVLTVLEVAQRSDAPSASISGQERFLTAVADCAAEFHRNALLRKLRGREGWWRAFADFSARAGDTRDLTKLAMELANGARSLLEVDRASILAWSEGRARMLAVSGVDAFDDRAEAVLGAEGLAAAVAPLTEALWYPADDAVLAPQVEEALARHLDASPAKELAAIPLAIEGAASCGVLLLERFAVKGAPHTWHDGWPQVARQCAGALESALAWDALPLGGVSRRVAAARRAGQTKRYSKILVATLVGLVLLAAISFIPAEFRVAAPGELQPVLLRHAFSGVEGEVVEVLVRSGQTVQKDQVLARLRSPKLDLETTRVLGELQTAQARLATLESARLESRFATDEDPVKARQLTAEEEELRETVKSLLAQQAVLNEERKLLEVRSTINGQVLTQEDELDAMPARPVRTGQQLFTVADVSGPWRLELHVPDDMIGHVYQERENNSESQEVRFVASMAPGVERIATVENVGLRAETDEDGASTVLVQCAVDASQLDQPRPGATVQARIDCGRAALGYVWFHQLYDRAAAWRALYL